MEHAVPGGPGSTPPEQSIQPKDVRREVVENAELADGAASDAITRRWTPSEQGLKENHVITLGATDKPFDQKIHKIAEKQFPASDSTEGKGEGKAVKPKGKFSPPSA